ncbi:TetR/AcrR family transcriptional regulator [Leptotrichia sp. OH3620_COT-345]|uniref:TetR/AcrR family transcriptional regulator n=1 Tax=Leptotrichia sp. OH3620_COT-345 TaxID=2491048 RepID=UPI000F6473E1|nr:TetR/AcrR family transcriptional regulator [Leptotrichia sp. OH3620_COT-345]RRD39395.1 TetR/AcrR family transcriptional regulator [Leptotrichia sp. OH3620_COT-345]
MIRKENKRQMIIDKSMELFCEKGYFQTKVDDITKALEISKGNFYTYFKTKEEVLYEILEILKEEKIRVMKEINVEKKPKEILKDFINKRSEIFFKYMKNINLQNIDSFLKDKKFVEYMEEIHDISINFLRKNVVNRSGDIKNKSYNDTFITEFILISMEGFFLDESLTENVNLRKGENMTREEKIEQIVEFIYNALK